MVEGAPRKVVAVIAYLPAFAFAQLEAQVRKLPGNRKHLRAQLVGLFDFPLPHEPAQGAVAPADGGAHFYELAASLVDMRGTIEKINEAVARLVRILDVFVGCPIADGLHELLNRAGGKIVAAGKAEIDGYLAAVVFDHAFAYLAACVLAHRVRPGENDPSLAGEHFDMAPPIHGLPLAHAHVIAHIVYADFRIFLEKEVDGRDVDYIIVNNVVERELFIGKDAAHDGRHIPWPVAPGCGFHLKAKTDRPLRGGPDLEKEGSEGVQPLDA